LAYAKFAGFEIPEIYDIQVTSTPQGERARTASGKLRADMIAVKRIWTIQTRPTARARVIPLLSYLYGSLFAPGTFWLKEFGDETVAVLARVDPENFQEKIERFTDHAGIFHNDGRSLTLTIEEV
jgi:hypothetical protein